MIFQINNYTYKSFKNYSGPSTDLKFKKKNVFFGYNGKGKTALSKGILLELKKDPLFNEESYRFFNKDFIRENLFLEDSNEIKGIIANFGKENVDIEKIIDEKRKKLKNIDEIRIEKEKLENELREEIDKIFENKKGKSSIKRKKSDNIKELLELYKKDLDPALKITKTKDELRNVKESSSYEKELDTLESVNIVKIDTMSDVDINRSLEIMTNKYNSKEIPTANVLSWLQEGLSIHKEDESKKCKFCGGKIELVSLEHQINDFLSDRKQKDLLELDHFYNKIDNIINMRKEILDNQKIIDSLIGNNVSDYYNELLKYIDGLIEFKEKIKEKLNNFEMAISYDSIKLSEYMKNINDNIFNIITEKQNKINNLNNIIDKSNILIKGAISLELEESKIIEDMCKTFEIKEKELLDAEKLNLQIEREINDLKKSKSTTNDFAEFINELLTELSIDFYLDIIDNNYSIKHRRDNIIIHIDDISEGENNLLALLFFYYELFDDKNQNQFKSIINTIIIDDPISSVDDVNKIYVLELVKKILNLNEPQIFIFTHVWNDFCDICYGKQDNVNTVYRFYEVKKNNLGSYLNVIKTNETPYMHDFKEIYEFSKLSNADNLDECEMYHYPNVMRKILEEFMKFKVKKTSPTLDNINNVKIALCGSVNCSHQDNIQIPVLLDTCNILSHKTIRNPEQILKSAKYLMRKIKEVDENHFSAMTN